MGLDYGTTWLGLMGGGISGSIIGGGSVYQIDVWNMGGYSLPARVLVTGRRVGLVAEAGTAHAMLIVTGCSSAKDMDGITSSGIDWEFAVGIKGSALVKTGASILKVVAAEAAAKVANWAMHEAAKQLVQWAMDGVAGGVQSGKQFKLLPSPLAISVGMGLFYDWQTMSLLGGKIGWQYISPKWSIETNNGSVRLQMFDIPEQDGEVVRVGFAVDEWGFDPLIRWKTKGGDVQVDGHQILGYVYQGRLFERPDGMGYSGINLTNLQPIGRLEAGLLTVSRTTVTQKGGTLTVRPQVYEFGNYAYWSASDKVTMTLDSNGCFVNASGGSMLRN